VLTTLERCASPVIRYRTGDITHLTREPCDCGRTLPRIAQVKKRLTETIFYKGLKLEREYVRALMETLGEIVHPYFWKMEFLGGMENQSARVTVLPRGAVSSAEAESRVADAVLKGIGIHAEVASMTRHDLQAMEKGKFKHFDDRRTSI